MKRILCGILIAGSLCAAAPLLAADLRPQVFFQPGVSTNRFTGDVGRFSSGSVGVHATQGVQFGSLGAHLTLGTDYYLTNQPPPPYTRGLQTFSVSPGLRFALPVETVRPIIGVEYTNLGVVSNALNRFTGNRLNYNAIGTSVAARWESFMPLFFELGFSARYFVDMRNPTASYRFSLSIGLAGTL